MGDTSPKDRTIALIKILIPEFKVILDDILIGRGYFNLPAKFVQILTVDNLPPWASFYENPLKMKSLAVHAMLGPNKAKEISSYLESAPEDEIHRIRENYKQAAINDELDIFSFDEVENLTDELTIEALAHPEEIDPVIRVKIQARMYLIFYSMITQVHYYLSIMTFGESICDLVNKAINGDDEAFCKAVQIDRTVLFGIPYFQKRLIRAQLSSDPGFLSKLANAIKGPSLGHKLSYRELMFVFAVLDDEGFLDMPLEQLMGVCQELGVYGREYGIEDVESLRKRRQYYRRKTGRQIQF